MNANRKSDESIVRAKPANKDATEASAELVEGRDSAKRNAEQPASCRTPGRNKRKSRGLHGVREAARKYLADLPDRLARRDHRVRFPELANELLRRMASTFLH